MTMITVRMDAELAARLRQRAEADAVPPDELIERALSRLLDERPAGRHLEFFGIGSSEVLRGDRVDDLLADGFSS